MREQPEIEITADGSHTLFVPELNEHYHSVNGAVQESKHVFIDAGLHHCNKSEINVFEVGFGTGLNAFLTLMDAEISGKMIHYTGIEAYPLSIETANKLNYAQAYSPHHQKLFSELHAAVWETPISITKSFELTKLEADLTAFDWTKLQDVDLIYFDAFAPDKQADLWTQDIFDNLYRVSCQGAVMTTYCAKGIVRRMMQQAGFLVERLPGPPGKREMLRAVKPC